MSAEKEKNSYYLAHSTRNRIEELYKTDNCSTRSEFVDKAVNFYCGFLDAEKADAYLPRLLASTLEGHLNLFADRVCSLLYRLTVEYDILSHIIACDTDIDYEAYERLRAKCIHDINRTNGRVNFKDALKFQKER